MAFYKEAEEWERQEYSTNPIKFIDKTEKLLKEDNQFFRGDYADPYFDEDSMDIRVAGNMRTVYVYIQNKRGESFFTQFDFAESIDTVYVNHEGNTVYYYNRVLCISSFFDAVKEAAEHDVRDIGDNLKNSLPFNLFDIKGRLSVVGSGSIIQGSAVWSDELSLSFKLCVQYVANEEHKELLARLEGGAGSGGSIDIDSMDGREFEQFCADLLHNNGFSNVEVTRGSGDQGIDVLATKDFVKYGFQCKCYSSDVGNKAVQEALAGKTYYGCHVAVVLTNRYFTPAAKELAEQTGVVLWDRSQLASMVPNAVTRAGGGTSVVFGDELRGSIANVKELYDSVSSLLVTMNEAGLDGKLFGAENEDLKQVLLTQVLEYMFWIIDAGAGISEIDAHIVSQFFGRELNASMIQELIDGGWIPESFADEEPSMMKAMTQAMAQVGIGDPTTIAIPLYENVGRLLVSVEEHWREERAERVDSYVALLRTMIDRIA